MRSRLFLPYAITAVLIAVGSSVAVVATARPTSQIADVGVTSVPSPSGTRVTPELSRAARVAYWRDDRLWVSNLDGSLRYPVVSVDDLRRVTLTRWSSDGNAVAFAYAGTALVVVDVQTSRETIRLPRDLAGSGYQIKDLRWSPQGDRIAATVLRPSDGRSDAYVVDLRASEKSFTRLTQLDDLFIGDWISDGEILAYTSGGAIAAISAREGGAIRLLSGATGVSPIIAPDGRIHFLSGRVGARDPSFPFQTVITGSVWSAATDGSDARRETTWSANDVRLDLRLADGRYLVHRGTSNALGTVVEDVALLPTAGGVIERARVTPDGRTAYGFTSDKIVRIDLTKLTNAMPAGAVSVFLDTSGEADIWFPSQLSLARGGERAAAAPGGRYVFALGGHLWQMEKGVTTLLRPAATTRRTLAPTPRWSPAGDHLLLIEPAPQAISALIAAVIDRDGRATTLPATLGAGRSFAWSPDGNELAVAVDKRGANTSGLAQWEVRFYDPSGRATRAPVEASEVAWTKAGIYVLANVPGTTVQAIQKLDGDAPPRTLTTTEKIRDPLSVVTGRSGTISGLDASPDGSLVSVRLRVQDPSGIRSFLVILAADGVPVQFIRADDLTDVAWSPTAALVGYTIGVRSADEHPVVEDPRGVTLGGQGRFAGWSPDGKWYLLARSGSLYAQPVAGGAAVRLGPGAVPVAAAASR